VEEGGGGEAESVTKSWIVRRDRGPTKKTFGVSSFVVKPKALSMLFGSQIWICFEVGGFKRNSTQIQYVGDRVVYSSLVQTRFTAMTMRFGVSLILTLESLS
jgi:hypothetical protein